MPEPSPARRYRFGVFELDAATGELRKQGIRLNLKAQPFQVLVLLLERQGELLTREEIARALWPDGTFVDYEHGVNSAVNRIRDVLSDSASNPRFVETLPRRGYRFLTPVETIAPAVDTQAVAAAVDDAVDDAESSRILASPEELPTAPTRVVRGLYIALQLMYAAFYVGALANLAEIDALVSTLPSALHTMSVIVATAAALLPVRAFVVAAVLFRPPGAREKLLKLWRYLFPLDELWALSPFLLLNHINVGLALACTALLVYAPFAQRSLVLMGASGAPSTPRR